MSVKISARTENIITGVVIELSRDAAANLSYALHNRAIIREWSWLDRFLQQLDQARNGEEGNAS